MPGDGCDSSRSGVALEQWIPYRLCCGRQHWGLLCPDFLVMCCICFHRFPVDMLMVDPEDGKKWDVCRGCQDQVSPR